MKTASPRGPIVTLGIFLYAFVSASIPLGRMLKPLLGDAADALVLIGFLWPGPLLLSLQRFLPAEGPGAAITFVAMIGAGLAVVWLFTSRVQQRLAYGWSNPRAYLWAPWIWLVPLLVLQAAVFALAFIAGFPTGE